MARGEGGRGIARLRPPACNTPVLVIMLIGHTALSRPISHRWWGLITLHYWCDCCSSEYDGRLLKVSITESDRCVAGMQASRHWGAQRCTDKTSDTQEECIMLGKQTIWTPNVGKQTIWTPNVGKQTIWTPNVGKHSTAKLSAPPHSFALGGVWNKFRELIGAQDRG